MVYMLNTMSLLAVYMFYTMRMFVVYMFNTMRMLAVIMFYTMRMFVVNMFYTMSLLVVYMLHTTRMFVVYMFYTMSMFVVIMFCTMSVLVVYMFYTIRCLWCIFLQYEDVCGVRPTQSIMYVPLQVNRFQKSILVIVQYKYLKSCSGDFYSSESDPPHKIMRYWFYYSI